MSLVQSGKNPIILYPILYIQIFRIKVVTIILLFVFNKLFIFFEIYLFIYLAVKTVIKYINLFQLILLTVSSGNNSTIEE